MLDRSMLVSRLKDDLASGRWGDEGWTRDGMRLVWRGRIIRDDETLGDVVRDVSFFFKSEAHCGQWLIT